MTTPRPKDSSSGDVAPSKAQQPPAHLYLISKRIDELEKEVNRLWHSITTLFLIALPTFIALIYLLSSKHAN